MCAQVAPSAKYLRGHGRVAVDATALRRLWQHLPVLGLVVPACVPVCAVLRGSLLCNSCGLSTVEINEENYYYYIIVIEHKMLVYHGRQAIGRHSRRITGMMLMYVIIIVQV